MGHLFWGKRSEVKAERCMVIGVHSIVIGERSEPAIFANKFVQSSWFLIDHQSVVLDINN